MGSIHFFKEDVDFSVKSEDGIRELIKNVLSAENKLLENLNYVFCSDSYLHECNS